LGFLEQNNTFVRTKTYFAMRKLRTRQHQIEDLGFNHVERHILNANFVVYRYSHNDYGNDGQISLFNEKGKYENGKINFQLKSTDRIDYSISRKSFVFDLDVRDLKSWLFDTTLMLLMLYDAHKEVAFYLDLQDYFKKKGIKIKETAKFVRVLIPKANLFTTEVIQEIRLTKFVNHANSSSL
jgi:Domain of unknown function (DUF4365)